MLVTNALGTCFNVRHIRERYPAFSRHFPRRMAKGNVFQPPTAHVIHTQTHAHTHINACRLPGITTSQFARRGWCGCAWESQGCWRTSTVPQCPMTANAPRRTDERGPHFISCPFRLLEECQEDADWSDDFTVAQLVQKYATWQKRPRSEQAHVMNACGRLWPVDVHVAYRPLKRSSSGGIGALRRFGWFRPFRPITARLVVFSRQSLQSYQKLVRDGMCRAESTSPEAVSISMARSISEGDPVHPAHQKYKPDSRGKCRTKQPGSAS